MADADATNTTEERIFEAALQVFSRKGKDGARMQEIAREAGINSSMLHYYFRSKDRLYEAVFGYVLRRLLTSVGEAMTDAPTFADVLRTFIDGYIDFVAGNQAVMRLMVNELLAGGPALERHARDELARNPAAPPLRFIARVQQAVEAGEIRPVDPFQTMLTIISGCIFFFIAAPIVKLFNPEAATHREAFIEARKAHLFDLLYNGLRANRPSRPARSGSIFIDR